jgi:hypothetical protein
VWEDYRWGTTLDANIYAQHVNALGDVLWTINGDPICDALEYQEKPQIAPDGVGGAFIVWEDYRNDSWVDIYAQRVSGAGTAYWDSNGVAVCVADSSQVDLQVVPDGSGGIIVVWQDCRGTYSDIYAQRVDGDGTSLWSSNGVPITSGSPDQLAPNIVSDGVGGAIVSWASMGQGVFVNRVDSGGSILWGAGGVLVTTAVDVGHQIATDDSAGAIVVWEPSGDIYAQRISANGIWLWPSPGVAVCTGASDLPLAAVAPDGQSGAIIAWTDDRNDIADIYANRVDHLGAIAWATNGIVVAEAANVQNAAVIVSDQLGGAIVAWRDTRLVRHNPDIFAQRLNAAGAAYWPANGVPVATATDWQWKQQIVLSAPGASIITWEDTRRTDETYDEDVYVQQVGTDGTLGDVLTGILPETPRLHTLRNYPNPFAHATTIEYELQNPSPVRVTIYDIRGKRVAELRRPLQPVGPQTIMWDGLDDKGRRVASGIYLYRVDASGFSQTKKMVVLR